MFKRNFNGSYDLHYCDFCKKRFLLSLKREDKKLPILKYCGRRKCKLLRGLN